MHFQLSPVFGQQARPIIARGDHGSFVERRVGLLVGHLEEQQVSELLDVIAITDPIVPQDVAVVPKTLDNGRRSVFQ
jgi:hypothetical protein